MALTVLYDGSCCVCRRSADLIGRLDWWHRCRLLDLNDASAVAAVPEAPALEDLRRDLHVLTGDGRILRGFDAVRRVLWIHPAGWLPACLLYLPGVALAGRPLYREVADRRYGSRRAATRPNR